MCIKGRAAPWVNMPNTNPTPCKGKSLIIKLLPLQGALFIIYTIIPRALPWAMWCCPFRAYSLRLLTHTPPTFAQHIITLNFQLSILNSKQCVNS